MLYEVITGADEHLAEALVAQQPFPLQRGENRLHRLPIVTIPAETLRQLAAGILASGEDAQGGGADCGLIAQASAPSSAAAARGGVASRRARICPSMSWAMAAFSRRNWRTLSLPWPMRSLP